MGRQSPSSVLALSLAVFTYIFSHAYSQELAKGNQDPTWASSTAWYTTPQYTTMTRTTADGRVYHSLWFHNNRFYAFLEPERMDDVDILEDGLSVNQGIVRWPAADLPTYLDNLQARYISGNALLIDFPFQSYSDNLGHWLEIMAPTFSYLKSGAWKTMVHGQQSHITHIILTNMNKHMSEWFRELLGISLSPGLSHKELPTIIDFAALSEYHQLGWLGFENLIVVQDRCVCICCCITHAFDSDQDICAVHMPKYTCIVTLYMVHGSMQAHWLKLKTVEVPHGTSNVAWCIFHLYVLYATVSSLCSTLILDVQGLHKAKAGMTWLW